MLEEVKKIREKLISKFDYLNGDIAENLGLEGEQAGKGKVYGGRNGKGVCTIDLQILVALMVHLKPERIVESGTYTGISCCVLAKVFKDLNMDIHITTIEFNKDYYNVARNNSSKLGLDNIEFINGNTDEVLADTIDKVKPSLIFLDGDSLSAEFNLARSKCDRIIGHDVYYLNTMLYAPRGVDFVRTSKYMGYGLKVFRTGECGIAYMYRGGENA